ncbi:MAG TPA: ribosome small subunit-dependent GTPase A [Planctomycetes bacterium]|nr:ribosome small subunit-dependent GTPase A [Planctomycetota bacterium]HIK82647.1 ribosome small subunit-dependent GTPase A [Planctomycetota bacterium]
MRGQVVFRSSKDAMVLSEGRKFRCELAGRLRKKGKNPVVVGDWVEVELTEGIDDGADGRIVSVEERKVWISRRRDVGRARELIIAANLDQVACVFSIAKPRIKFGALDRLLMAAAASQLPAFLVLNKIDLGIPEEMEERLAIYPRIGIEVLHCSATADEGLDQLKNKLEGKATVLTGPSGVGKSSLISKVLGIQIRTSPVSEHNEKGKHTTTAVTWHTAEAGTAIIDTPGFRDWALWGLDPCELAQWMPDLAGEVGQCRFRDCLHRQEPGCGVLAALSEQRIDPLRYRSYIGILDSVLERQERDR